MSFNLSRRRFLTLSGVGVFGAGAYGATRAVRKVRETAARLSSQ